MAGPTVQVTLVGWREASGRFAAQHDELVKRQQQVARDVLAEFAQRAQELSPRQDEETHARRVGNAPAFADQWETAVSTKNDGAEGALTNRAGYANLVLFPTRPHAIDKDPGWLAFEVGGEMVFTHHVDHPGTAGHREIAEQLEQEMQRSAQNRLQRAAVEAAVGIEGVFSRFAGRL